MMYLIDSNILIRYLANDPKAVMFLQNPFVFAISEITFIEILSYPYNEQELAMVQTFLEENFIILSISRAISLQTAKNRRQRKIKTLDAIIGATAICHHCTLVTHNTKDFAHLPIKLLNPID